MIHLLSLVQEAHDAFKIKDSHPDAKSQIIASLRCDIQSVLAILEVTSMSVAATDMKRALLSYLDKTSSYVHMESKGLLCEA